MVEAAWAAGWWCEKRRKYGIGYTLQGLAEIVRHVSETLSEVAALPPIQPVRRQGVT
jgi:hypothetical protein